MNADGSGQVAITGIEGPDNQPAWSPDGTKIAYISNHSTSGGGTTGPQVFVKNADGSGTARQVTGGSAGASRAPAWSPAGDLIAYANTADGTFEIYTIDASATVGAGVRRSPAEIGKQYENPSWSPDAARIAFERGDGTNVGDATKEIWTMKADGTDLVRLTTNTVYDVDPAYSPDGTKVAFESNAGPVGDQDRDIFTMAATPGAAVTNITNTTSRHHGRAAGLGEGGPAASSATAAASSATPASATAAPAAGKDANAPACEDKASAGTVEVVGCLTRQGDGWISTGNVWVNGLAFVPAGGAQLIFNPKAKRLHSIGGQFALWVRNSLLKRGTFDWDLSADGGVVGAAFGAGNGTSFGKLPATGDIRVRFVSGFRAIVGAVAQMPFFERLQALCAARCPRVTAEITMVTDNKTGLQHRGLELSARNVLLGLARVETFNATYDPVLDRWEAKGMLVLPSPMPLRVSVDWITQADGIVSANASLRNVRTPLAVGVFIQRLDLALQAKPVRVHGSARCHGRSADPRQACAGLGREPRLAARGSRPRGAKDYLRVEGSAEHR